MSSGAAINLLYGRRGGPGEHRQGERNGTMDFCMGLFPFVKLTEVRLL